MTPPTGASLLLLTDNWRTAWRTLGIAAPAGLYETLVAAWTEPQRAYHTLQHLAECIALFEDARATCVRPAEVALALWFHDAVYDLDGHDNESRSAEWARAALLEAGVDTDAAERVHALVMATRHDASAGVTKAEAGTDPDAQLLLDIDLSILGAPPARFAEYEAQIRREYAQVPSAVFEPRRKAVLGGFLAREAIYRTPAMHRVREAQARRNLVAAVSVDTDPHAVGFAT